MDPRTANMLAEHARTAASTPPISAGAKATAAATGWASSHKLAAGIALAAAIVASVLAYDALVIQPEQLRDQAMLDARTAERVNADATARQVGLEQCLSAIKIDSDDRWAKACKASRQRLAGCSLPVRLVDEIDRQESAARLACLRQFSLTMQ